VLDFDGLLPVFVQFTDGKTHDIKIAEQIVFPAESVVLVDRAYVDFEWLYNLDSTGVFFVTRLKKKLKYEAFKCNDLAGNPENITADEGIIFLGQKTGKKYPKELRRVEVTDPNTGEILEFLTNNLSWKAETSSELYRQRWEIEQFFKDIKTHLKIKTFVGISPNAVYIQVWTAMITILLLKLLKELAKYGWHLSNLAGFIRLNLFVKIDLWWWLDFPFRTRGSPPSSQLEIFT